MRSLPAATQAALEKEALEPRDFVWFRARSRDTGLPVTDGYWSDVGNVTVDVIDPETDTITPRTYAGAAGLIQVSAVQLVSGLTTQPVTIRMSQVSDRVAMLFRGYDVRQARVQLHRTYLNVLTMRPVGAAVCRFDGYVDDLKVRTPPEGEEGNVTITCVSNVQELRRSNSAKRSDADQRLRLASDSFLRHTATVANWQISWGQKDD